jgi:hypothetical protein
MVVAEKGRPNLLRCNGLHQSKFTYKATFVAVFRDNHGGWTDWKSFASFERARQSRKNSASNSFHAAILRAVLVVRVTMLYLSMELSFVPPHGLRPERASA